MNKDEFYKKVYELSYSTSYYDNNSYDKKKGFEECKEKVLKLITELDIEGMTPATFELFRNAMNDLTNVYQEMFRLQKELQEANRVIIDLQKNKVNASK